MYGTPGGNNNRDEQQMSEIELNVRDIKPDTKVGYFWLKKPRKLKLDLKPKEKSKIPIIEQIGVEESSNYIGICIRIL